MPLASVVLAMPSLSVPSLLGEVLAPVFALVLLGALLRGRLGLGSGAELGRLLYWVALPAQLIHLMARADLAHGFALWAVLVVVLTYGGGIALALVVVRGQPPALQGSLINGALRPNGAFIGLPIITLAASQLAAGAGPALTSAYALLLGPAVIAFNIGAVIAFRLPHHNQAGGSLLRTVAELGRNPILIGCLIGSGLGWWRPGVLDGTVPGTVIAMLSACAVPLALIVAGLELDFAAVRGQGRRLLVAAAVKLVGQPAVAYAGCRWLGLDATATTVVTVLMASPAAIGAVPMARILGGDPAVMSALVTVTTVAAPLTMLAWLWLVAG
jgi:malonate transporter